MNWLLLHGQLTLAVHAAGVVTDCGVAAVYPPPPLGHCVDCGPG